MLTRLAIRAGRLRPVRPDPLISTFREGPTALNLSALSRAADDALPLAPSADLRPTVLCPADDCGVGIAALYTRVRNAAAGRQRSPFGRGLR